MSDAIPKIPKGKSCDHKKKYGLFETADRVAKERSDIAGHSLHAYWCKTHQCFHVGRMEPS